jgi:phosphoribosylformylglycinamidine cyclo-ligase
MKTTETKGKTLEFRSSSPKPHKGCRVSKLNYQSAGVDIAAGNEFVSKIKQLNQAKCDPNLLAGIGGFGALYAIPKGYDEPVLVSATDGVGTKLKLAIALDQHDTIGIDLVAMCVNDILVSGAKPLFFLDYFATGQLRLNQGSAIIAGIVNGCQQADMQLIGGETAEMPGMYHNEDYDLAGFCVGIVERSRIIDGKQIQPGDQVIGLASSGFHANGFSLIRKIIELKKCDLNQVWEHETLGQALLAPTRIYVTSLLSLRHEIDLLGMAHITGGGLLENIPRILPESLGVGLNRQAWPKPKLMQWIQEQGDLADIEMYRTFNCGIGMVIIVRAAQVAQAIDYLNRAGETAWHIGSVVTSSALTDRVHFN